MPLAAKLQPTSLFDRGLPPAWRHLWQPRHAVNPRLAGRADSMSRDLRSQGSSLTFTSENCGRARLFAEAATDSPASARLPGNPGRGPISTTDPITTADPITGLIRSLPNSPPMSASVARDAPRHRYSSPPSSPSRSATTSNGGDAAVVGAGHWAAGGDASQGFIDSLVNGDPERLPDVCR